MYRLWIFLTELFTGYYCPTGQVIPCPNGTYNNLTGMSLEAHCVDCSVGKYCEGIGNSYPTGLSFYQDFVII